MLPMSRMGPDTTLRQMRTSQHSIAEQMFSNIPATIMEWNKLDVTLGKSESLPYFSWVLTSVNSSQKQPFSN